MGAAFTSDSWIKCPRRNTQASLRLFCFPYAGGGASIFRTWPDELSAEVEVCAVQLPGRENRLGEVAFTQLAALVEVLAQTLHPYFNIPFIFFGHSMGALISFELARLLRRWHCPEPLQLFISGCSAPQTLEYTVSLHQLPNADLIRELRLLKGTPEAVLQNTELMHLMLPVLRADFEMTETYRYCEEEPLQYSISVYSGTQDNKTNREKLKAWSDQTSQSFTLQIFPGDHFFLHTARPLLLEAINREMDRLLHNNSGV